MSIYFFFNITSGLLFPLISRTVGYNLNLSVRTSISSNTLLNVTDLVPISRFLKYSSNFCTISRSVFASILTVGCPYCFYFY